MTISERISLTQVHSHGCQAGSASTMEKIPRVLMKLLYLKPDFSKRCFLHGRQVSASSDMHIMAPQQLFHMAPTLKDLLLQTRGGELGLL